MEKCGGKSRKKRSAKAFFDAFSCFFLSREERRGLDEERKKPKIFLEREEKEKIKLKREFSDEKENGRREKNVRGGFDRSIEKEKNLTR